MSAGAARNPRLLVPSLAGLVAFIVLPALARDDDAAVRAPLEAYLAGHATGDPEVMTAPSTLTPTSPGCATTAC